MTSIDEKNNEILVNAVSNVVKINNKDFPDDIEYIVSLKLIKEISEIEICKIEAGFDVSISDFVSIFGIVLAFLGIGISEIIFGMSLSSLGKDISSFSWHYIKPGLIIVFLSIVFLFLV